MFPLRIERRRYLSRLTAILVVTMLSCGDFTVNQAEVRLRPLVFRDREAPVLLRPQGVAMGPVEGSFAVVESGRRTLTLLGESAQILERRTARPVDLPPGATAAAGHDLGAVLVRVSEGYWTRWDGLGPVFIPDHPEEPPRLLGAGLTGLPPRDGQAAALTDLSDVRGLAADEVGVLLLAVAERVFRLQDDELVLLAGSGQPGPSMPGPAVDVNLSLGMVAGMTVDSYQQLYVCDHGSGRIWRLGIDSTAEVVAGGGYRFNLPSEPIIAFEAALDLGRCQLAWDESSRELVLLAKSVVYRIAFPSDRIDAPVSLENPPTIRVVPAILNLPRGLALSPRGAVVTSLRGTLHLATDEGSELLWEPPPQTEISLGWAAAVQRVGAGAFLMQDPAQRRISLYLPDSGTYLLHAETSPSFQPSAPLAADEHGNVYFVTAFGLRYLDVNGPTGLVGLRVPDAVYDGQSVTEFLLPYEGELRADERYGLWLLDRDRRIVLRIDSVSGEMVHAAGAIQGGGEPRGDQTNPPHLVSLSEPSALWIDGELALVVNSLPVGGDIIYGINMGDEEREIAGLILPPERVGHLGGGGGDPYMAGQSFQQLAIGHVRRVVSIGNELVASLDDRFAPPLVGVDRQGFVSDIPLLPDRPPDALAPMPSGVLAVGWENEAQLVAINPTSEARSVCGLSIGPQSQVTLATVEPGVRDLIADESGHLFCLSSDGRVLFIQEDVDLLGTTTSNSRSMAVAPDGGIFLLNSGGLWGVAQSDGARFLGEPLPSVGGDVVLEATDGWVSGTRIWTLPFGENVTGLAIGPDDSLYWTDCVTHSLLRAFPSPQARVEPSSEVHLVSRGDPVGGCSHPVMLEVSDSGQVFLGRSDQVFRYEEGEWRSFAGAGPFFPTPGLQADEVWLSGISGLALDQTLFVRSRQGLIQFTLQGEVVAATRSVESDACDPDVWAFSQSLDLLDGRPLVVFSGDVYQVVGWP